MDYCTLWPEGWWSHCCAIHDAGYAAQAARVVVDAELFRCVADSAATPLMVGVSGAVAVVMWVGVRVFGGWFYRKR